MDAILTRRTLDALMPMHLLLNSEGRIEGVGRALQRLAPDRKLIGSNLRDVAVLDRPAGMASIADLNGRRVALHLRNQGKTYLRGHGVAIDGGRLLLNLALALGELQKVGDSGLTAMDFAPTDPTLDMLYLIEANHLATTQTHRLIGRLQSAKTTAETQATTDPLTGLVNRRGFDSVLTRAIADKKPFALAHVDLDHFKAVNDRLGHPAGDAVLVAVARRLRDIVRTSDTVARVGGRIHHHPASPDRPRHALGYCPPHRCRVGTAS